MHKIYLHRGEISVFGKICNFFAPSLMFSLAKISSVNVLRHSNPTCVRNSTFFAHKYASFIGKVVRKKKCHGIGIVPYSFSLVRIKASSSSRFTTQNVVGFESGRLRRSLLKWTQSQSVFRAILRQSRTPRRNTSGHFGVFYFHYNGGCPLAHTRAAYMFVRFFC